MRFIKNRTYTLLNLICTWYIIIRIVQNMYVSQCNQCRNQHSINLDIYIYIQATMKYCKIKTIKHICITKYKPSSLNNR